ncbi:hypothetical protein LAD12857_07240 [Lacrimispora amygdalina]|uniref:Uncharacterized protein n=1 Tax=Lacrimispora amygdalina TaxID=253257 RepID=A0ABQ5M2V0_9FIRM
MKNYKISSETLLALGVICCLLFMRYYETALYYRNINLILDTLYGYIAIPLFYFLISACLTTIFIKLSKIRISKKMKIFKLTDIFLLIIYMIVIVLRLSGYMTIGIIPFSSIYRFVFIAWGCIFASDFCLEK